MRLLFFSNIKGPDRYLPLNLLTLASYAVAQGHQVTVVDGQITPDWLDVCRRHAEEADLLAVSSYTGPSIAAPARLVRELRAAGWSHPVAWGGYHATLAGPAILRDGLADYAVSGPGEETLAGLMAHLDGEQHVTDVPGLTFREGDTIRRNPPRTIRDLDRLLPLDYSHVPVREYFTPQRRIVQYISSYGCPYACTFCAEPAHSLRRWNGFSPERILRDLRRIEETYRPDRVSFVDPNFSTQPRRVAELVKLLVADDNSLGINCNMRARDVLMVRRLVPLELLAAAGFRRIFIGVESGSDDTLDLLRKSSTAEQHVEAILALDAVGIEVQASFIHDLPDETDAQAEETIAVAEQLIDLRTPGSVQSHHFYMPYPGTELGQEAGFELSTVPTEDWATSSTFRANEIWRGNRARREWVVEQLTRLHHKNPAVITEKEIGRLDDSARIEHDYVQRFML
ncbi:B12-binding domain-containing radical SAM protein [Micromonospora marina]|uniref:B12-binding domain-containing radical SAM protein n=1 Tax=Micromonospora marina TaxID=307120 RepID=UPI003D716BA7